MAWILVRSRRIWVIRIFATQSAIRSFLQCVSRGCGQIDASLSTKERRGQTISRTKKEVAESILREGFRDGSGTYLTHHECCGVWVSDRPLDANESAWGDTLLEITLAMMTEADFQQFEWIEEGKG